MGAVLRPFAVEAEPADIRGEGRYCLHHTSFSSNFSQSKYTAALFLNGTKQSIVFRDTIGEGTKYSPPKVIGFAPAPVYLLTKA